MANNILNYFKYSKIPPNISEFNDIFNVNKWKNKEITQNLNIIVNNLDSREFQNFIIIVII